MGFNPVKSLNLAKFGLYYCLAMKYEIIEPPKLLEKYVRYFSTLDYHNDSASPNQIKVFADRYPHLVFQHDKGRSAFHVNGNPLPTTFISGIKTKPYTCFINSTHSATTVTFHPPAIKILFGIDVHELNDELIGIQDFAIKCLDDRLLNTKTHAQRVKILVEFLCERLSASKHKDQQIVENINWCNKIRTETTLPVLQEYFKVSERQLERKFKATMGLLPKQYLRTTRFEKALALIRTNSFENLSDVAYTLNFTDQSHFIKDFKEFAGFTPKVFLKQKQVLEDTSKVLTPEDEPVTLNHLITT
jgi:AraC-like DNA-binding protein